MLKVNCMKFPQHLLKVLEKTNPEIMDIYIINHEEFPVINQLSFDRKFKFIVNLRVSFNDKFNDYVIVVLDEDKVIDEIDEIMKEGK